MYQKTGPTDTAWVRVMTSTGSIEQPALNALMTTASGNTGIYVVTSESASSVRSIVGAPNQIVITNGSGVTGNPTVELSPNPSILSPRSVSHRQRGKNTLL